MASALAWQLAQVAQFSPHAASKVALDFRHKAL
jgi:hypothetical protein